MGDSGKNKLGDWTIEQGYRSATMRGRGQNAMAFGSLNAMVTGEGFTRAYKGELSLPGLLGSRKFFNADQSYAGLGSRFVEGLGSVFSARQLLAFIGSGQLNFNGAAIATVIASSTLSVLKKSGGVYAAGALTGPFQAGHAQPSAPTIFPKDSPSAGQTPITGAIVVAIHRVSGITGQVSLVSLPSNVLTLSGQSCIVQLPLVDANGQDIWGFDVPKIGFADLGVLYQLPTSLGGETLESVVGYSRIVTGASIADTTNIVDITDADVADQFTSADVGRRITFGGFDSWITGINSPTQCTTNDSNTSGAPFADDALIRHAVDGILRGVEITWTNGALYKQPIAPTKAFPPPAAQFAGVMRDTFWVDADGIIYVGEPGYIGSYPPSSALFASEPAVVYLEAEDGVTLRFGKHSVGSLYYTGGTPAIEYQQLIRNQGVQFAQNVGIGFGGRACAWLGKPTTLNSQFVVDFTYSRDIKEFESWNAQDADSPICFGYDGLHQLECWFYQNRVFCKFGPTGAWCAPVLLNIPGNVMDAVTVDHKLYFASINGPNLELYQFDAGTGSTMLIYVDEYVPESQFNTITQVEVQGRADNLLEPVQVQVVTNFGDVTHFDDVLPAVPNARPEKLGTQHFKVRRPYILEATSHSVLVTMSSQGGDHGVDRIITRGAASEVVI